MFKKLLIFFILIFGFNSISYAEYDFTQVDGILNQAISTYDDECKGTLRSVFRKINKCFGDMCDSAEDAINTARNKIQDTKDGVADHESILLSFVNDANIKANNIDYNSCSSATTGGTGNGSSGGIPDPTPTGGTPTSTPTGGSSTPTTSKSLPPSVNCFGLPGCVDTDIANPTSASRINNFGIEKVSNIIGQVIQFVAVIAVIALILSGIMYLISGGDEEKVKKAKSWITWSLVGVVLSISAWGIINMLNTLTIG